MILHRAWQFKLKPTRHQEQSFRRYAGASRWVWNHFLAARQESHRQTGSSPSVWEQMRELTALKQAEATAWLGEIHSQVLQEPLKHLQSAFVHFFEKRAAYPRSKSRKATRQTFTYPQGIKVHENQVYLPKIGWVRFRKSRDVLGVIKRATISHKASGWYMSLLCEVEVADPVAAPVTSDNTLGIDLGLKDFLVASDGYRQPAPQLLRRAEKKLAKAQRALARAQRGSRRYEKLRHKVARLHEHVTNARRDFLHKLSTTLVCETQAIMAESLTVKGLGRTRLAKSVQDAGWGEFLRQIAYKCAAQGKTFHQIDRFFPSTKLHGPCNTLNELSLAERTFVCQGCGTIVDRDLNAAQNIKQRGLGDVLAAGQSDSLTARRLDVSPVSTGHLG